MRDEHIGMLDPAPKVFPHLALRRASNVNEITADFNVRAIENRDFRTSFADERDEAGHLRIVDENNIGTARSKRTTLREPVSLCIVFDPLRELLLLRQSEAKGRISDALEDVYYIQIMSVYAPW
jgi:hypothetical protein